MKKTVKRTVLLLSLLIIAAIGYYGYSIITFGLNIEKKPEESRFHRSEANSADKGTPEIPEWEGKEKVNILLMGGDSRGLLDKQNPRSDTMMVLSLDPVTKQAYLFSILRDTYVEIPGHWRDRANAALAYGGPELAMRTISNLLGIPIQYYVFVDFEGFIALVDAIGGIDYYVEKDMKYISRADGPEYSIDLKQGMQHLDGNMALQYVRFRHDALSDYARTERQRNFLKAVAKKMQTPSSLITLPNTLKKVEPYIETNLSLGTMLRLAKLAYDTKADELVTEQLPPHSLLREERISGSSVITVDPEQLRAYVQEVYQRPKPTDAGTSGEGAGTDNAGSGGSGTGGTGGTAGTGRTAA
jgi:LCP family protein required for cell wall assembly